MWGRTLLAQELVWFAHSVLLAPLLLAQCPQRVMHVQQAPTLWFQVCQPVTLVLLAPTPLFQGPLLHQHAPLVLLGITTLAQGLCTAFLALQASTPLLLGLFRQQPAPCVVLVRTLPLLQGPLLAFHVWQARTPPALGPLQ